MTTLDEAKDAVLEAARKLVQQAADYQSVAVTDADCWDTHRALQALDALPKPECARCNDRERVWRGEGPTSVLVPCPECAVYGVWAWDEKRPAAGHWRILSVDTPPHVTRRAAEAALVAFLKLGWAAWRAEVRRMPEKETK